MDWYLGTVGFGYKPWLGTFYPSGLKPTGYLSHYAETFTSVEIDSTFYGTPDTKRVIRWGAAVPNHFQICPKTPQHITHEKRLEKVETEMTTFVETMRHLGPKLGPILIQLPPDFVCQRAEVIALKQFIEHLPSDLRFAFEFRHLSWERPETNELLERHNLCRVSADYIIMPKRLHVTTDFAYIRFLGRHGRYETKDHERRDPTADLKVWVDALRSAENEGSLKQVYGYFNNDFSGYSPESCHKFKRLLGLDSTLPQIPIQGSLF